MTTYFYYLSSEEIVETFESLLTYKALKMYVKDKFNGTFQVEIFYGETNEDNEILVIITLNGKQVFEDFILNTGNDFIYLLEQHKPDSVYKDGKLVEETIPWCYENDRFAVCRCSQPCRLPDDEDEDYNHHNDENDTEIREI